MGNIAGIIGQYRWYNHKRDHLENYNHTAVLPHIMNTNQRFWGKVGLCEQFLMVHIKETDHCNFFSYSLGSLIFNYWKSSWCKEKLTGSICFSKQRINEIACLYPLRMCFVICLLCYHLCRNILISDTKITFQKILLQ